MIFENPLGLLGLLAIPAILALHFFRSRRQVRRIGGLHFWSDAPSRMPMGRRWDRLLRSLSLLFQLLSALLLALLLAGLDSPNARSLRHYTIILDDSASMQASDGGKTKAPVEQGRKLLRDWAPDTARYTVVAAGVLPRVVAGPFAPRQDLMTALDAWQPEAGGCDLGAALALAGKFAETGEKEAAATGTKPDTKDTKQAKLPPKILFVTDDADAAKGREELIETAALGRVLANVGFTFADRGRISAGRDRVLATVKNYSGTPVTTHLRALVNGQPIFNAELKLGADAAVQQAFETEAASDDIRIELDPDPLLLDNALTLAPVAVKFVKIGRLGMDFAEQPLTAVVRAIPYSTQARAENADLLLTDHLPEAGGSARVVCFFNDHATTASARVTTGNDMRAEAGAAIFDGVGFEGVLWPYNPGLLARRAGVVLAADSAAGTENLVQRFAPLSGAVMYTVNVRLAISNLFKQTAWPLMVRNLVEETRQMLPGLARSNFNAGEVIQPNLAVTTGSCELRRDGKRAQVFENPPSVLTGLTPGAYDLLQGEKPLAHFAVNLIAPGESDLRLIKPAKADLDALPGAQIRAATLNPTIFYALLLSAILAIAGAWVCQDRSR